MKKFIALLLALITTLSFTACGKTAEPEEPDTLSEKLIAAFEEAVKADSNADAEALAVKMSENELFPFMTLATPLDSDGWFPGLNAVPEGFESAASFGPAISTIPFIGYVFELKDGIDADTFVKSLEDSADLGWNICTHADEMASGIAGNKVCFVMTPASFDEE